MTTISSKCKICVFMTSNPFLLWLLQRVEKAIKEKACNALLLKVVVTSFFLLKEGYILT